MFLVNEYQLCHAIITRISCIKVLGIFFNSKLQFHSHVHYIISECRPCRPYSLHNLQFFLPGVFVYTVLHFSQVRVGICLSSLELCHVD
jgi:hypothetical protein